MTMNEALHGSTEDREQWIYERLQNAEHLEKMYRRLGHTDTADEWKRETTALRTQLRRFNP